MRGPVFIVLIVVLYSLLDAVLSNAGVSGWPFWEVNLVCIAISIVSMTDIAKGEGN
jgi:hypothetical protein